MNVAVVVIRFVDDVDFLWSIFQALWIGLHDCLLEKLNLYYN